MQEQILSCVSFAQLAQLGEDAHLNHLFQALQDNQDVAINAIKMDCEQSNAQDNNVVINPEQVVKGYDSDDGYQKRLKNKKIKKKKPMYIEREEQNKKRRIKLYIQSLQNRVNQLQSQNQKLKKINQLNINYIRKLNDSQHIINGFFIDRKKLFSRIEKLLSQSNPDISKIEMQCETVKLRQGAFGHERIRALNYYFKQILHMITPTAQSYVVGAACNSTDIFSPDYRSNEAEIQNDSESLLRKISISDQIIQQLKEKQQDIIGLQNSFSQKVLSMYKNKCELIMISRQIEKTCEICAEKVSILQKAKFFCYAEKAKQDESSPILKTMYEQLQKCNKFSYNYQYISRKIGKDSGAP